MKWIPFVLILSLSPNLPLFQTNQSASVNWLIYEDAAFTRSEKDGSSIDWDLWFDLRLLSYSSNRAKPFFQLKNQFSFLLSRFQGVSPFWRPPPAS
jgi:hypothetical protein